MTTGTSEDTLQMEVKKIAGGDSDSLVGFYNRLYELSQRIGVIRLVRTDPSEELIIGSQSATILKIRRIRDRLTHEQVRSYAENPDSDIMFSTTVYDLLDHAWRTANDQELESKVEVMLL